MVNEDGILCYPNDLFLPMKREGSKSHLCCGISTMKLVCPKMKWQHDKETKESKRICHCDNSCTASSCGRVVYVYPEQSFCAYPETIRGTEEWDSTYKICVNVEKSINHFNDSICIAGVKHRMKKHSIRTYCLLESPSLLL